MLKQMPSTRKKNCKKNNKISGTLFKENSNEKIKYNHSQLLKTHKVLKSL